MEIKKYNSFILEREQLVGGKSDGMTISDIAKMHSNGDYKKMLDHLQKQLKIGIKVEGEHTDDIQKCTEIAMDHLSEDPNYYLKLKKIENGGEPISVPNWKTY